MVTGAIAFAPHTDIAATDSGNHVYLLDISRHQLYNITERLDTFVHANPSWSPDGKYLVIQTAKTPQSAFAEDILISTMTATGRSSQLFETNAHALLAPRWSPTGEAVTFWSFGDLHIFLLFLETGESFQLTTEDGTGQWVYSSPVWSPDGQQIAFTATQHGESDIFVMNIQTGIVTALTDDQSNDQLPIWSPDGDTIAFISNRDGQHDDIFIMRADGSDVRRLTDNPAREFLLMWLPDSRRFVFRSSSNGKTAFHVLDSETGNVETLWTVSENAEFYSLAWRP